MTLNEIAKEWDETTEKIKAEKKDIEARKYLKRLKKYCEERKSCEGCVLKQHCRKKRKRKGKENEETNNGRADEKRKHDRND